MYNLIKRYCLLFYAEIDNCVNYTCQNGGSCVNGVSNYSCSCSAGYTGDHCEIGKVVAFTLCYIIQCGILDCRFVAKKVATGFMSELNSLAVEKRTGNATVINFPDKNWMLRYDN